MTFNRWTLFVGILCFVTVIVSGSQEQCLNIRETNTTQLMDVDNFLELIYLDEAAILNDGEGRILSHNLMKAVLEDSPRDEVYLERMHLRVTPDKNLAASNTPFLSSSEIGRAAPELFLVLV